MVLNGVGTSGDFPAVLLECRQLRELKLAGQVGGCSFLAVLLRCRQLRELKLVGQVGGRGCFPAVLLGCRQLRELNLVGEHVAAG